MTDTSAATPTPSKGGVAKATASGIYLMVCQNITPTIVGYVMAKIPFATEATTFELVVFLLGAAGSFMVWLTPQHAVDAIVAGILFIKATWKKIKDAATQPQT